MQDIFEKIKEGLKEKSFVDYEEYYKDGGECLISISDAIEIVNQVAEEYNDGWIPCSERLPECEEYAETDALLFQLATGTIEVGYFGKKNPWRDCYFRHYRSVSGIDADDVLAWQPLPELYKPKGDQKDCNTCANYTEPDEIDNGCYMCCKGLEDNYQPKGEKE